MAIERIETADDARVADYRGVSEPELVRRRRLFIAEGRLVVERLIQDRRHRLRSLLLTDAAARALAPVLSTLEPDVPVYVAAADHLASIAGFNIHRGCLALAERAEEPSLGSLLAGARLIVALEHVTDPDNVGGVFRSAVAFGVDAVVLSPTCCDPLYRKAIRTSMAATLRVPFARVNDWPGALDEMRGTGATMVALTPRPSALTLDAFVARGLTRPLVLLVGTEGDGLTEAAERAADVHVRIPIRLEVDSLNLAVATGIALARLSESPVSDKR